MKKSNMERQYLKISKPAIREAVAIFDNNQTALGKELNMTRARVNHMVKTGDVPPIHCRHIEHLTGGVVTAERLNPFVFAPVVLGDLRWAKLGKKKRKQGIKLKAKS